MVGSKVEKEAIIRRGARMLSTVANATVPRIAVIVRKAYGAGYVVMSGASMQPDACIALPQAQPAIMGAEAAVNAMYFNKIQSIEDPDERQKFIQEQREIFDKMTSMYGAPHQSYILMMSYLVNDYVKILYKDLNFIQSKQRHFRRHCRKENRC